MVNYRNPLGFELMKETIKNLKTKSSLPLKCKQFWGKVYTTGFKYSLYSGDKLDIY
jgi:hypothetical protein